MQIVFIPGHGEDTWIFDKLHPLIAGKKVFVDNWHLLSTVPGNGLNATVYAQQLIHQYTISGDDVVIGHSMGGWVGLQIKQLTGCRLIHISSFTTTKKIISLPFPRSLLYWLAKRGWGFNDISLKMIVFLYYRNKPSKEVLIRIFRRLQYGNKDVIAKKLMIIFNPLPQKIAVAPDVRIHARPDHIVKYPDEPFAEVPGDHFSLYTYPEAVAKPIVDFLSS